jgi:hypothetical protein
MHVKRIWMIYGSRLWALTETGQLLVLVDPPSAPVWPPPAPPALSFQEAANGIVDMAPAAPYPFACAVRQDGKLLCAHADSLSAGLPPFAPLPGAGPTRRVFGGGGWICAEDEAGDVRCCDRRHS